ncbi:MAG: hypothetical protein A2017_12240 [Lentisphaerae bacterium GWF2_44_16]|nr:MAG: hypothetical protein A2017_12240 [Lentisphaerae bacterium GWF2_44_16]
MIRIKQYSIFLFLSVFLLSFTLRGLETEQAQPLTQRELETITKLASTIISKQHYKLHPLDDEISSKLFNEYFKTLDPSKLYFSKEDIKKFEKYRNSLDDQMSFGKIDFAFELYSFFLKRLEQYRDYTDKLLDTGFDFTQDENLTINRIDADWPENEKELKELWRKKAKNDVLTLRLIDRAAKEGKNKTADNKIKPHPSWGNKSPEERVKKRTAQLIQYFKQNEPIDILELYLSSLAKVYDPHSAYMSPRTEEDFNIQMKLSLLGIGALLSSDDGYTKIVKVIPGGPAEKEGSLKSEDRIIAVAQEGTEPVDIIDMPLSKVVNMIRGPKDTNVYLTVIEGAKGIHAMPKVICIKRDTVKLTEQEAGGKIKTVKKKDGALAKIGIITLPSFYMDFDAAYKGDSNYKSSTRDVKNILENFQKENVDGVIIDLRSNGGGSLVEAIKLTGLFIKSGPVVQVKNNPEDIEVKYDTDEKISYNGPLIVLLNKLSASAAEIFAGAIKDYKRGILIGDSHTHGKGTVQTVYDLKQFLSFLGAKFPAGSIKFTNAQFYRINGSSTQMKGVEPDIVFPSFTDSMEIGEENLPHALPWDTIKEVSHDYYSDYMAELLPELRKHSLSRQQENPKFALLKKDIESFDRIRKNKTVSLNEKKRWADYTKEKKIQDEQSKLMKLDEDSIEEKANKSSKKDEEDLYMDEGLNILADYLNMLSEAKANKRAAAK